MKRQTPTGAAGPVMPASKEGAASTPQGVSEQQVSRQRCSRQRPDRQSPSDAQADIGSPVPPEARPISLAGRQNPPPPEGAIAHTKPGSGSQSFEVQQAREQRDGADVAGVPKT